MLREWLKYSYGVFEEVGGFVGDPVYPAEYRYGGQTVPTRGCEGEDESEDGMFCEGGDGLDSLAPTKQNLQCRGETARHIIFSSPHLAPSNSLDWSETAWTPPRLTYLLPGPNHYSLVLDLSQSLQDRWDPVRKSLFRFIQNIPAGSTLSIVTQVITEITEITAFINDHFLITPISPQDGEPRLALPSTLVTEANREEISSRVPRRVPARKTSCLKCSLDTAINAMKDYKVRGGKW